jgi:acyl homoserine lactone synthase
MIEFGLARSLIDIVTVTDVRVERILRRAGWPLRRISEPSAIGDTKAVAGYLEISPQTLLSVRRAGGIMQPVLWAPVLPYASAIPQSERPADPETPSPPDAERDGTSG